MVATISPAFCLEDLSKQQCRQGKAKQSGMVTLGEVVLDQCWAAEVAGTGGAQCQKHEMK